MLGCQERAGGVVIVRQKLHNLQIPMKLDALSPLPHQLYNRGTINKAMINSR